MNDGTQSAHNDVYLESKTFGSLFTGIAGLDLGLERAGWQPLWQSEIDPYACKVLKKHYPHVPNLGDVTQIDWSDVRRPDLVCGGFPCQPVSTAGARKGDQDERWLWPEVERCIRLVRPGWVLLENVPGLLTLGFGQVAADLADLRYDFRWDCIPAAAVGAPHLRYRIFIVAHAHNTRARTPSDGTDRQWAASYGERREQPFGGASGQGADVADTAGPRCEARRSDRLRTQSGSQPRRPPCPGGTVVADPDRPRPQGRQLLPERPGQRTARPGSLGDTDQPSEDAHATPSRPRRATSEPGWWEPEPDVGRVAHGIPARVDRLRCLGNAVVPQVAELVARMWLP